MITGDDDENYTEDEEGMPVLVEKSGTATRASGGKALDSCTKIQLRSRLQNHRRVKYSKTNPASGQKPEPVPVKLDFKPSQPVSLVDTSQKGISLSQAVQTNKQPC